MKYKSIKLAGRMPGEGNMNTKKREIINYKKDPSRISRKEKQNIKTKTINILCAVLSGSVVSDSL